jgi:hypothetical protein
LRKSHRTGESEGKGQAHIRPQQIEACAKRGVEIMLVLKMLPQKQRDDIGRCGSTGAEREPRRSSLLANAGLPRGRGGRSA